MNTLDPEIAVNRLGGDEELYWEIVQVFVDESPTIIGKIRSAFSGSEWSVLERHAHSLKSASANIGAELLRSLATKLESDARCALVTELEAQVLTLCHEMESVLLEVEKLRAAGAPSTSFDESPGND